MIVNSKKSAKEVGLSEFYAKAVALFISRECKNPPILKVHQGVSPSVCLEWESDLIFSHHLDQLPKPSCIRVDGIVRAAPRENEQCLEIMYELSQITDNNGEPS